MKKFTKIGLAIVIFLVITVGACQAGEYLLQAANTYPQFSISQNGLSIWGSAIKTATGFSSLSVTNQEIPYDTIKAWYATMLTAKITNRVVRVLYENSTGKITAAIPR